jgi:transcriptional regulator with XRE-family HTH domain
MLSKARHERRYRSVPGLLRAIREEAGLTQRDIGRLLKRPQSWVHNCETGSRRVDVAEFCDWCEACGVEAAKVVNRL